MSPQRCTVEWRLPPGIAFIDHLPGGEAAVYLFEVACVDKTSGDQEASGNPDVNHALGFGPFVEDIKSRPGLHETGSMNPQKKISMVKIVAAHMERYLCTQTRAHLSRLSIVSSSLSPHKKGACVQHSKLPNSHTLLAPETTSHTG